MRITAFLCGYAMGSCEPLKTRAVKEASGTRKSGKYLKELITQKGE